MTGGSDIFLAAIAAMALTFARSCARNLSNDDLLVIAVQQLSKGKLALFQLGSFRSQSPDNQSIFVQEILRAMSLNVDYSMDQEKLMRNLIVPKVLSLHASLGFRSFSLPRDLPSQLSWVTTNLRFFSVVFTCLYQGQTQRPGEDYAKLSTPIPTSFHH